MVGVLRRGSAARMDYIRRFVAVMLALVLCMGLIRPPRAQAAAAAPAVAATAAVNPLAALGVMLIALAGVAVAQEAISSGVVGSAVYDHGQALMSALAVNPECSAWYRTQQKLMDTGLKSGTKIAVPEHVMKAVRSWVIENFDFTDGPVSLLQNGLLTADGTAIVFTQRSDGGNWGGSGAGAVSSVGTLFPINSSLSFSVKGELYTYSIEYDGEYRYIKSNGVLFAKMLSDGTGLFGIGISQLGFLGPVCVVPLYVFPSSMQAYSGQNMTSQYFFKLSDIDSFSASGSLSKTPALDLPLEGDQTMTVPNDIPMTVVDGVTVPVITTMDRDMILEGAEPIDPPIVTNPPIVEDQTMVGDVALEDVAAQQESLGAVFVSKFPFCIPWDMYNAVKLLVAPAKTPYWEVDFLAPISSRVGGWRGSTKVVIDMGEYEIIGQLCRWVSTILFCATLISGTKKLIWTG